VKCGMKKKTAADPKDLPQYVNSLKTRITALEEKYRLVVDHARVIVFQTDISGCWTFLNPAWREITGFAEADSLGAAFENYIHPDDRPRYQETWAGLLARKEEYLQQEVRCITKNIGFRWMEVSGRILLNDEGAVTGLLGTMNDISDRKMTEDALEDSERRYRRYRQMFIDNPAIWLVVDPETGRIADANAAAAEFYGYSTEELKTMVIFEVNLLPVDKVRAHMNSVRNRQAKSLVFQHRLKNGEIKDVEVYSGPFETGDRTLLSSMVIDITAKRQAEAELRKNQARLEMIIEGTQAGLWDWDIPNNTVHRDGRLRAIFGYEGQLYSLEDWENDCHPEDISRVRQAYADCIAGRTDVLAVEYRFRHSDGNYRWVRATGKYLFDQTGRPVRCLGSTVDITDKKRMEELQKENEFILRDFAQVVSDMSFILDEDGRYIEAFGDQRESLRGLTVFDAMPFEQAAEFLAEIRQTITTQTIRQVDHVIELAKGKRMVRSRTAPMSYTVNGKKTVAVVIQDVTDQEKDRRMLQATYEMRRRSDFINDLMNGTRPLDEPAMAYGRNLGLDFSRPLLCCVIACSTGSSPEAAHTLQGAKHEIIDALNDMAGYTAWTCRDEIGILCQAAEYTGPGKTGGLRLAGNLRERIRADHPDLTVVIGISAAHCGPGSLKKSGAQAWETVRAAQCGAVNREGIFHYDDMGIMQLLMECGGQERADEFIQGTIGKLIEYDREKGTGYLATLEVMLGSASLKEAASTLFLHHNTAVYRKRRIEKMLGMSINGFEVRMALAAAIKLHRLKTTKYDNL
jgi:PAS domain S-box-containing protein